MGVTVDLELCELLSWWQDSHSLSSTSRPISVIADAAAAIPSRDKSCDHFLTIPVSVDIGYMLKGLRKRSITRLPPWNVKAALICQKTGQRVQHWYCTKLLFYALWIKFARKKVAWNPMQGKFHVTVYVETHTNELSCHDFSQPLKMLSVLETYFFRAGKDWTDDMENGTIWQKNAQTTLSKNQQLRHQQHKDEWWGGARKKGLLISKNLDLCCLP